MFHEYLRAIHSAVDKPEKHQTVFGAKITYLSSAKFSLEIDWLIDFNSS